MQVTTNDTGTLEELNTGYSRSVQMSDVQWFEKHLAGDLVNSNPDGSLADRAQFLAAMARPCALVDLHAEDVRVRLLGDVALIHARTVYTKPDGEKGSGRYTDIYARRGERWQCVAAHVTRG